MPHQVAQDEETQASLNGADTDRARRRTHAEKVAREEEFVAKVVRREVAQWILGQDQVSAEKGVVDYNKYTKAELAGSRQNPSGPASSVMQLVSQAEETESHLSFATTQTQLCGVQMILQERASGSTQLYETCDTLIM